MRLGQDKEIYLIRHGETAWNKLGKSQGQEVDIPLNNEGRDQVKKTGQYLQKYRTLNKPFDCIFASPSLRAKESAEIIQRIIGLNEIQYDENLKESKKGKLAGLLKSTSLFDQMKEYDKKIQSQDPIEKYINKDCVTGRNRILNEHFAIGYETNEELEKRATMFIKKLIKSDCKKIIVVSHGFLLTLIRCMFKINEVPFGNFENGSNCWISYIKYNDKEGFRMISPPDTEHLGLHITQLVSNL
jgi:broad specificity phosphatase PhoE